MTALRIGIDARAAAEVPAGKGRYVREVLRALARRDDPHTYVLFGRRRWEEALDERFSWRLFQLPDAVWHARAAFDATGSCDVFLATASYLTPWFLRIPTALVVHDLIAFREDVHVNQRAARIERATLPLAVRRSQRIVCDSGATRSDLVSRFPRAGPKSTVVYPGVGEAFRAGAGEGEAERIRERYSLDRPFVLCAGTLEPRKNLARVIEAFAKLPERLRDGYRLAVVGPRGWDYEETLARAQAQGEEVTLLGQVPDQDLAALYRLCTVFCFPSLYEGFGLPLLEGMAAGAACITSNVSSLPEVGGDAVRYIDPQSVEAIGAALAELLESEPERRRLGEQARERACSFSWARTAEDLVRELAGLGESVGQR